jgi:signal transduction histidine kinase
MKEEKTNIREHKLFDTLLITYLVFLAVSFLMVILTDILHLYFLLPLFTLLIFIFSLLPAAVFTFKFYRPLEKIIQAAAQYASGSCCTPLEYNEDNELGLLAASVNHLAESSHTSAQYRKNFISNISHDFRSPLTSIKGYVEAILDGTIPPEMQDKYLLIVVDETERLNQMMDALLKMNTYADCGMPLNLADFDLVPLIKSTTELFAEDCSRKNLQICMEFDEPSMRVTADADKIMQVLCHLLKNAVKFSYENSEIAIRVTDQNSRVLISVKDNGVGIAKEHLDSIWYLFYKADTARCRDKKGIGLGLPLVQEILRAHGQNIDVISTEGAGSEFIFTLDKAEDALPPPERMPVAKRRMKCPENHR